MMLNCEIFCSGTMEENITIDWKNSLDYLLSLINFDRVSKLDVKYFNILSKSEYKTECDDLLEKNLQAIAQLMKKFAKDVPLCIELSRVFFMVVSWKWPDEIIQFIISGPRLNHEELSPYFNKFNEEHNSMLYLGMIAFVTDFELDSDYCKAIDSKSLREIERLLPNVENVEIVVCWANLWVTFLLKNRARRVFHEDSPDSDISKVLFSVVIAYWNHTLVHRSRIDPLVSKILEFEYLRLKSKSDSKSINDSIIFQYMMDVSWKVPFKYFVCRHLLSFAVSQDLLAEVVDIMKEELSEGFAKSLRNKNNIGVEMELFLFCLNHFPYEEWRNIVFPIVTFALQDTYRSNYFAKCWLPHILRKFPIFAELLGESIFENHDHSKVLVVSLKICYLRKIPLHVVMQDEIIFINYLKKLFCLGEDFRGDVFSLLCELHEQSVLHSELELSTILSFLKYNVNANHTCLRQMMLSSFSKFILRLLCSCIRVIKRQETEAAELKMNHVMVFLLDLNDFIADGLQSGCSYQRKITSLNMLKIVMNFAVHECELSLRSNNLNGAEKFVEFMKKTHSWRFDCAKNRKLLFNCLMDSCDEIQHLAAVLLRNYFLLDGVPEEVFEEAIRVSNDKKFYKRSSGYRAVVSFIVMAHKSFENPCQRFGIQTSFRHYFLDSLEKKIERTEKDILDAAVNCPWDADVRILNFLMNNPLSNEFDQVSQDEVDRLITLLERIVPLLLRALFVDKSADYAPSFEESDLALHTLIKNSVISESYGGDDTEGKSQLLPLNQLLLNFIWISLKFCSDLESTMVVNRTTTMSESQVIRCCNLITIKLKLCRHKGLIEAAGVSLAIIVKSLTSQNLYGYWFESEVSEVLYMIEFKSGATISRKSAGLSILIQNIIGNDKRTDKPLIRKCWKEFKRILNVDYDSLNVTDVFQELPQTHALHLLKVIVADARNTVDLLPYLEEITNICLTTLKVPVWVIRNAALQLFGIILLKIVGQRNPTPMVGVRFSFEEIFLTMPKILDHIMLTLEQATRQSNDCLPHSDVVPVLVILASLRLTSLIILDKPTSQKVEKCRILTEQLLSSDLYAVRELAAKAFLNLHSPKETLSRVTNVADNVIEYIKNQKALRGENHVHGYLFLLKQIFDVYPESRIMIGKFRVSLLDALNVSLVSQTLLFDLNMVEVDVPLDNYLDHVRNVMNIVETKRYLSIGYEQWLCVVLKVPLKKYSPSEVLEKCTKYSHRTILMTLLVVLLECEVNETIFPILLKCLENYIELKDTNAMNRIMTTFTELHRPHFKISFDEVFFDKYFDLLKELNYYHYQGVSIHLLGIAVANFGRRVDEILQSIHECLDITKYNKNIRLNAAFSMLKLSTKLDQSDINMKLIWTIILDLVQDEEADIRNIGSKCFVNVFNIDVDFGPEVAMNELFNVNLIKTRLSTNDFVDLLWDRLKISTFERNENVMNVEELNPFDQGIINCYAEEVKIVKLAGDTLIDIFQKDFNDCKIYFSSKIIDVYFDSHINDVLKNYQSFCNEYLVNSNDYLVTLRCYYVLYVFRSVKDQVERKIDECVINLKKILHF